MRAPDPASGVSPDPGAFSMSTAGTPGSIARTTSCKCGQMTTTTRERRTTKHADDSGALAIVSRHDEERRANWSLAMSAACLSAIELGRVAELRAALVQARALPAQLTADGFKALATPALSVDHQLSHLIRMEPCLDAPAKAGPTLREQLRAAVTALKGAGWESAPQWEALSALLRDDRQAQVAVYLNAEQPSGGRPRALRDLARLDALFRWRHLTDDPRVVARFAEARAAIAEQHAGLPARLAAEGLTMRPAAAASKAP